MAQKTVIIAIIKGLDKRQAAFVRARLRGQKGCLYDFYLTSNNPENLLEAQKAVGLDGNRFASLKVKLESEVMQLLANLGSSNDPQGVAANHLQRAKLYQRNGHKELATKEIGSALALMESIEDFAGCIDACHLMRFFYGDDSDNEAQLEGYARRQQEITQAFELLRLAEQLKSIIGHEKHAQARDLAASLLTNPPGGTAIAQVFHLRAGIICSLILKDFVACTTVYQTIWGIIAAKSNLLHNATVLQCVMSTMIVASGIQAKSDNPKEAIHTIGQFSNLVTTFGIALPLALDFHLMVVRLHAAMQDKQNGELDNVLESILGITAQGSRTDERRLVQIFYLASRALVKVCRYSAAGKWLRSIRKYKSRPGLDFWFALAAKMELVVCLMDDSHDDLSNCVRRAKRRFQKGGFPQDYSKLIIDAFSAIAADIALTPQKCLKLASDLKRYQNNPDYNSLFDSFDLVDWIKQNFE